MKGAKEEAERALQLVDFTIERAADSILWIDSEARIYRVNEATCRSLGYSQDELLSMTVHDFDLEFPEDVWPEAWAKLKECKVLTLETHFQSKEGRIFPVEVTANFIEFRGKEYSCSFVRDITERKRAEEELRNAIAEVEHLKNRLEAENIYLQDEIKIEHNFEEIISCSKKFSEILHKVEQVASTDATVLILGETGTGKGLIARAVHSIGARKDRPLVKLNCAVLPANLIESELFGHEKGAFTGAFSRKIGRFELADGGTIFLDEIGDLPMELQVKLSRVLQEGEFERLGDPHTIKVDVRIIAATNRDLGKAIENRDFREDLYYRLNVFPIEILPLREHKEDIPLLVEHFVMKYGAKTGKKIETIPQKVINVLQAYHWPGNVRELESIVEWSVVTSQVGRLKLDDWLPKSGASSGASHIPTLEELQREHIIEVLELTGWRVSGKKRAAKILRIKPTTLESRMKRLDIKRKR